MKIKISCQYSIQEGKPYCAVNFFGLSDQEYLEGKEDFTYNCAFILPDSLSSIEGSQTESILPKIIENIENGINQIFTMYKKDLEKLNETTPRGE